MSGSRTPTAGGASRRSSATRSWGCSTSCRSATRCRPSAGWRPTSACRRPTLRAVIDELVREGLLLRRHGSGTYVAEPKIALPLTMTSFSEDMTRRGMRPSSRVVAFELPERRRQARPAPADLAGRRGVGDHPPAPRRRRDDGDRVAARAARACSRDLRREELADHSFYELLRERRGIAIASGVQTIEPTVTSPEEAELLGVPVHSPAFLFERTTAERRRGGGGVRPVRVPRGPVPAGDGAAPGAQIGPVKDAGRPKAAGEVRRCVARCERATRQSSHPRRWRGGRMRKFSVAAAGAGARGRRGRAAAAATTTADRRTQAPRERQALRLDQRLDHGSGLAEDPGASSSSTGPTSRPRTRARRSTSSSSRGRRPTTSS